MPTITSRIAITAFAASTLLAACDTQTAPPRESPVMTEVSIPSPIELVDGLDGRSYGFGQDRVVYEIGEPLRAIIDASALLDGPYVVDFHMESADTAWIQVDGGADAQALHRVDSGGTDEVITQADLSTASGLEAIVSSFDVGPDGTLWVLVESPSSLDDHAVCVRPAGGSLACTRSSAVRASVITALGDDAILSDVDSLQRWADGVVTDLPVPASAYGVGRVSALDASRALVMTMDTDATGIFVVDTSGNTTALLDAGAELLASPYVDVFVRGESDVWFSSWQSETVATNDPLCVGTCTSYYYAWQQWVVWHWDGAAVREIGHTEIGRDDAIHPDDANVLPIDGNAVLLEVGGSAWLGTR